LDRLLALTLWAQDQEVEGERQQGDEDQGGVLLHVLRHPIVRCCAARATPMELFLLLSLGAFC
jgi:hypothetical protein